MKRVRSVLLLSICVIGFLLHADSNTWINKPLQPPDTQSPRATLFGFIEDANEAYLYITGEGRAKLSPHARESMIMRMQGYLDVELIAEHIRDQASIEAAIALKEILDRLELPAAQDVPGEGDAELPPLWRIPGTNLKIVLMTEGPNQGEYLFSGETVIRAVSVYDRVASIPMRTEAPATSPGLMHIYRSEPASLWVAKLIDALPDWVRNEVAGQILWQWIGLVLIFVLGLLIMFFTYKLARIRAAKFKENHSWRYVFTLWLPVVAMCVPLWMKHIIKQDLVISGELLRITDFILGLLVLLASLRLIWAIGNRLLVIVINHPQVAENQLDTQFIRLSGRILTVIIVVIVFIEGGKRLGIPLTTLVAGAGISGLAVALAAQDSLKNILGSIMLILDKPFGVNDRIIFKNFQGFVQEIGLRSTKIKLLTGNMASIPNEVLARMEIENVSKRPSLRKVVQLHMPLDTPWRKTEKVLERIREWMQDHEGMPEDQPPRVFLQELSQVSCMIQVMFWYAPPKTTQMLVFSEKLMFEMLKIAEEEGVALKFPLQLPLPPQS
ncbi:mechanosensitive ion channel family protein [Kiritimatiellota bacterium B12222]|nr:mechanosensitive ion channel family protein [Kiritimatiellota bacterium B12222]